MIAVRLLPCLTGLLLSSVAYAEDPKPIVDNERVTVWDLAAGQAKPGPIARHEYDVVTISFARNAGTAVFEPRGSAFTGSSGLPTNPVRTVLIALKDHPVPPLPNKSGYANAFPRPGVKKVLENDRVTVWDYTWLPDKPTPMHFHDKDVVVVYLDDGALKSTTPDGKSVVNRYSFDFVKFNPRDRTHTELLVEGHQHAIMTELK